MPPHNDRLLRSAPTKPERGEFMKNDFCCPFG